MATHRPQLRQIAILRRLCLGSIIALGMVLPGTAQSQEVTIFAAASTTGAVEDASRAFEQASGIRVRTVFAASSILAKQVAAGAPADLYLSASVRWMDYLEERGRIAAETRVDLLGNTLVLVVPVDSPLKLEIRAGVPLVQALGDRRLAMGDPNHVPAGIYGKAALQTLGLWSQTAERAAFAGDVRAALALVDRGEAAAGLVYGTDAAISDRVRIAARFPPDSHPPITYPLAVVADKARPEVLRFHRYLTEPEAGAVFRRHGFTRPGSEG
jgi:molybdate transport system substrate-binding protein